MIPKVTQRQYPEYHENMLLVKTAPMPRFAPTMLASAMEASVAGPLAAWARTGLIRRVVSLGRSTAEGRFAMVQGSAPGIAAESSARTDRLADVHLIELHKDAKARELQLALATDPRMEYVSLVPVRYLAARKRFASGSRPRSKSATSGGATIAKVPLAADTMWNLRKIKWREARQDGLNTAASVHVGVLDTGVDLSHPDLPGPSITFVHDYPASGVSTTDRDIIGHGTHVSGTIRALIDNSIGVNGICDCQLSVYKIFGDDPTYDPFNDEFVYFVDPALYLAALSACLDAGVQVINLSIGGRGTPSHAESQLFAELISQGTVVVAAMGNEGSSILSYPAAIPGVIAVGASAVDDTTAGFSNSGSHIALCAPGTAIWSTLPTDPGQFGFLAVDGPSGKVPGQPQVRETDYDAWDGTSMATPHVTASAALVIQRHGSMAPAAMKTFLMQHAERVPAMQGANFTNTYGAGRLNLVNLA